MPDGRAVMYLPPRLLPLGASLPLLSTTTVTQGDRLDSVAARTLGDPLAFWRIADANDAVDPFELTAVPGRTLRIPVPQP
jgi:hypothetical protein